MQECNHSWHKQKQFNRHALTYRCSESSCKSGQHLRPDPQMCKEWCTMSLPSLTQCISLRRSQHICKCEHAWGLTALLYENQHHVHCGIAACLPSCHASAPALTAMHVMICLVSRLAQLTLGHCRPTQCKCHPPCTSHMLRSMQHCWSLGNSASDSPSRT